MNISASTERRISVFAWAMAVVATIGGQVHAVARGLAHPDDWAESPLTRAWEEPVSRALRPIFDWSDPRTVYLAYGKIWIPVCIAFLLAAWLVHRHRRPTGWEGGLWRVTLAAYTLLTLSLAGDYLFPRWMDGLFLVTVAVLLALGLSGIALGTVLLRSGFRPRITPWLLISFLPFFFVITEVTSMGSALLPLSWGWAIAAAAAVRGGVGMAAPASNAVAITEADADAPRAARG